LFSPRNLSGEGRPNRKICKSQHQYSPTQLVNKGTVPTITCAICGKQRGLDKIRFTLGVGVTISPASSKSECADTMLCNMDKAVSPT